MERLAEFGERGSLSWLLKGQILTLVPAAKFLYPAALLVGFKFLSYMQGLVPCLCRTHRGYIVNCVASQ